MEQRVIGKCVWHVRRCQCRLSQRFTLGGLQMRALSLLVVALLASQAANAANPRAFELLKLAMALTPDVEHGKILYAKQCAACHGGRAGGNGPREVPALAGQREYYLLE